MKRITSTQWINALEDQRIVEAVEREQSRLRNFIWKRVADRSDAEDILQEVFFELVEAYRLAKPIEQVGAWLFRVARNRITDLFRKTRTDALADSAGANEEDEQEMQWVDLLPAPEAGPEAAFARNVLLEELEDALQELPEEQREVFIAHELEGRSFKELALETGLSVNTLLSRKHYAVLHLRQRLQAFMTNLRKEEDAKYEQTLGRKNIWGPAICNDCYCWVRPGGTAVVELAHAEHLWAEPDQFLASGRFAGAELDPLRRIPRWPFLWSSWTAQYEGALGTNDSGTARQIS